MGILDDAIREHLELKRAHGASDDEIRRKEAEAFGAIRQEAAAVAAEEQTQMLTPAAEDPYVVHTGEDVLADEQDAAAPAALEHLDMPTEQYDMSHAAEAGAGMLEPHTVDAGPPSAPDRHHHDEEHPALADHKRFHSEEHAPEPVFGHAPESQAPPPDEPLQPVPEDPYVGDPPYENPAIDEPPPRQSPETGSAHEPGPVEPTAEEDVLEETPEFLQDAPEHDRLWFEQKPPRDFDFGE